MIDYPMQPITMADGVPRFEQNPIVNWLCEQIGMNNIAIFAANNNIDDKYQMQVAQLVGYSVGGYSSLGYVSDESYYAACAEVDRIMQEQK